MNFVTLQRLYWFMLTFNQKGLRSLRLTASLTQFARKKCLETGGLKEPRVLERIYKDTVLVLRQMRKDGVPEMSPSGLIPAAIA